MIKFTFAMHDWFSQDLVDATGVFLDLEETYGDTFQWQLKRWSYTPFSAGKLYRKLVVIEREGYPTDVVEWWAKEQLEDLLAIYMYEEEKL